MYEYNEEDFEERPSVSEEQISKKKVIILSIGKTFAGIATFLIVLNLLTPTPTLPLKIVAQKTASTIAEYTETYYTQTGSLRFINTRYVYGEKIIYNNENFLELPEDYNCVILDSTVVVEHKKGIKAEVRWR
ncbi:MAG: hypothetical protein JXR69_09060 [Candidatus Delongbacteria bacterium]|nr:hypothetical protein [Candidatus Delongbacteria bacterium]